MIRSTHDCPFIRMMLTSDCHRDSYMSKSVGTPSSRFDLPTSSVAGNQDDLQNDMFNTFIDIDTVRLQRQNAYEMVDVESQSSKDRLKTEFESNKLAIELRANHDLEIAQVNVEQSRQHALFVLDQQHAQRRLEIEQRAQEQKLSIETAARHLLLQAQEQRLNKDLNERLLVISRAGSMRNSVSNRPQQSL
jgi:hypothetical protein